MAEYLPRRIYVVKRNESDPEDSKMVPEEGIPAYRDIARIINSEKIRLSFTESDVINIRRSLLESGETIHGPAFAIDKPTENGKVRTMVYTSTEFDIRIPIEYIPITEFVNKREEELMDSKFDSARGLLFKGTGVFYPYYLVEPGEFIYIPYTNAFSIVVRKIRFRGLIFRLGRIGSPEGGDIEEYLRILENVREGVDKIIMKPVPME